MSGRIGDQKDRYGRDLRALTRIRPNGTEQSTPKICGRADWRGGIWAGSGADGAN